MAEVFDQVRFEVDEVFDVGDSVVGLGWMRVRGAQSGATAPQRGAIVFQLCDGRIVAYRSYIREEQALEAVGLRE
jgi:ketosteroid isomerase-like protein